jgi:choline-sulfatase
MTRRPPNILFLMTDQQRFDALGSVGGWVKTPVLDRIAAEGVTFTACHTTSPLCIPARFSLALGLYPHATGVWNNGPYTLDPAAANWMQAVRAAGYRTSLFGKTHLHARGTDLRSAAGHLQALGLDDVDETGGPHANARLTSHLTARWAAKGLWDIYRRDLEEREARGPFAAPSPLPLEEYADVYVADRAVEYLREYRRPEPWFCWVSFGGPHEPWDTPEPYASLYTPADMPLPRPKPTEEFPRPAGLADARKQHVFVPGQIAALRANYAGNVTLIDDQIGRILAAIEARGELADTAIVFTSDHGEMNGDAGMLYKGNFLDPAVRVPLLVRPAAGFGSCPRGRTSTRLVELPDVGATIAEFAGATSPPRSTALSLGAAIRDPDVEHRAEILAELKGEIMLVTDAWKLVLNAAGEPYQMFDRGADPLETRNLAGSPAHAGERERLCLRLLRRLVRSQVLAPGPWTE